MKFLIEPYTHQLDALKLSCKEPNLALFWEMGTGKTKGLIEILRYRYTVNKRLLRTLILGPVVTLYNWKREFGMHSRIDNDKIVVLDKRGGKAKTKQLIDAALDPVSNTISKSKIVIMNYEAIQTPVLLAAIMEWQPEILVCDESHYLKNHRSKRAKMIRDIADRAKHKYLLTGTPILNSVLDIFYQYRILDGGATFGRNFSVFRSTYCEDLNAGWASQPGYFPKFEARPETYSELHDKIYGKALRVLKKDCLDLPPLVKEQRLVDMSPEQRDLYKQMKTNFIAFIDAKLNEGMPKAAVAKIAATKALRLLQITSGYVTTEDGELHFIKSNPRMDETEELLKVLTPDHQVILWCCFRPNYLMLEKLCQKLKLTYSLITGKMSIQEKNDAEQKFRSGKAQVCIANRRAAGIGINLVEASYSIIYSRNFSLGEDAQSESRNHRKGSEIHKAITRIDLAAAGTIDEWVLEKLSNKQQISDDIIDRIRNEL